MNNETPIIKFRLFLIFLSGILIFGLLQYRYLYHLFFLEQIQLFLSRNEYAIGLLTLPGGFTEYVSEYYIQFFNINGIGSICVTALLLLIGLILHLLLNNNNEKYFIFIFEYCILFFLLMNILDINFYLKGIIGYLFCIITLLIYQQIQNLPFLTRFFYGLLLALTLFWIAAPFQTLFLITASAIEFKKHRINKGKSLLPLLVVGISSYLVYLFLGISIFRMYIDIDGVCSLRIIPGWTKYAPWVILPIALLITPLTMQILKSVKRLYITVTAQSILILTAFVLLLSQYDDSWSLPFKQLHHYASQDKWDNILHYCKKHDLSNNYACLNYQNLALAEKGILADSLLAFPQKGKNGLYAPWDRTVPTAFAIQKVCYNYGDIAFAQKFAFEGNVLSVTMGYPETMKTLVRTNIIKKEYRVAAKYIYYLKHTFSYKEWADKQSRYLSDSLSIKNDPEYKGKQINLEKENHFAFSNELHILAGLNKEDKKLRDFVLCSFLLDKDLKGFLNWFDFYSKEIELQKIPIIYYQALMACVPSVPEILTRYQIPEEIKEDFEKYSMVYSSARNSEERKKWLFSEYKNSYWYYFHYTDITHE